MAIDAIAQVAQAEAQAEEILQNAALKAKQLEDATLAAEAQVKALMDKAEAEAEITAQAALAQAEGECEKLRVLARGRMEKAAALIVEKVVKR